MVHQVIAENYLAVRLRVKAYVLDTRYEKLFETDVRSRSNPTKASAIVEATS